MMHKGHILKDHIKRSPYSIMQVADELSINRSQFSTMLNKPEVKQEAVEQICTLIGVDASKVFDEGTITDYKEKYLHQLEKNQKLYEEVLQMKNEMISLLKGQAS